MAERVSTRLVTFGPHPERSQVGKLELRVMTPTWSVRGQMHNPLSPSLIPEILSADVVHCHQQHILMSSLAAAACRLSGRRVFATDLGGGGWDISAYLSTDRWFDGHLHISDYSRNVYGHAGKPWARVIFGGVDTDCFCPDAVIQRSNRILFVGRLLPHKGIADLIAALPSDLPLDVVGRSGDAEYCASLKALAAHKSVSFREDVEDGGLIEAYRRALCLVLPSVYRVNGHETKVPELLGQTLLEAMACGTPVICTNVASLPEVVEDGVTGFIVAPGDCQALRDRLSWLATHPHDAAAMGDAGRTRVIERFQWPQVVSRCLDAYHSLPEAS
jgi:glycosyltransferase involved in cell wall biosynthesis